MSLNHLTSRTDEIWPSLNIGCASIASSSYLLKSGASEIPLVEYQAGSTGATVTISSAQITVSSLNGISFTGTGGIVHYEFSINFNISSAGEPGLFNVDLTMPTSLLPNNFSASTKASGFSAVALLTGGVNRIAFASAVSGSRIVRFTFSSLPGTGAGVSTVGTIFTGNFTAT